MTQSALRRPIIGIVPAAGRATRLPDRSCSKELIAVGDRAISEYLVEAMVEAGAERICMVIAPDKHDIVEFYGNGERHRASIAYVCQERPTGMSDAIDQAYPWLRGATVLMGMPDTIVQPEDSLARIRALLEHEQCDIALAIAPTSEPERLGPVNVHSDGRVLEVFDKPPVAPHDRVWTVACWSARFTEFLHQHLRAHPRHDEAPLGLIFQAAIAQGLDARAITFSAGCYIDAGTIDGLQAAQRWVAGTASQG
jgi:glucose-1-phosphate thymidylyltransferase